MTSEPWFLSAAGPASLPAPRTQHAATSPGSPIAFGAIAEHGGWALFFLLLAPILGPHNYGLFVVAAAGVAVTEAIICGLAVEALVAIRRLEPIHLSTAFVSVTGVAAAVSFALYTIAGFAALAIDDPIIGDMVQSLSLVPLLGALTVPPIVLLRRSRRTTERQAARLAGVITGGAATLTLAAAGAGPWSLVAQIIVQRFVEILVLWLTVRGGVALTWSHAACRDLALCCSLRVLSPPLSTAARYIPGLLAGLILGPIPAGLYIVADRVLQILTAAQESDDPASVGAAAPADSTPAVMRLILSALVAIPLLPIVLPAVLEPRWWGAVLPAQIMAAAAIPMIVQSRCAEVAGWCDGRRDVVRIVTGLLAAGMATPYGLTALVTAVALHAAAYAVLDLNTLRRSLPDRGDAFLSGLTRGLAGAAIIATPVAFFADPLGSQLQPLSATGLLLVIAAGGVGVRLMLEQRPGHRLGAPRRTRPGRAEPPFGITVTD